MFVTAHLFLKILWKGGSGWHFLPLSKAVFVIALDSTLNKHWPNTKSQDELRFIVIN